MARPSSKWKSSEVDNRRKDYSEVKSAISIRWDQAILAERGGFEPPVEVLAPTTV